MMISNVYQEMAVRTGGNIYIGVVGPVRTGKSTFIKRFMETVVLPAVEDEYLLERARDELPQSGSGRTIMTVEPKFVPETAVELTLQQGMHCGIRLVDCVGYMVAGASGSIEDGAERMVMTPWYDYEIPMSQAAEEGTYRVIAEHSTIGILLTTDGSICGLNREDYCPAEQRAAEELQRIGKPYVILLNSVTPNAPETVALSKELEEKYGHICIPVNCLSMEREEIEHVISCVLSDFPITKFHIMLPAWVEGLRNDCQIIRDLYATLLENVSEIARIGDAPKLTATLSQSEFIQSASILDRDLSSGELELSISMPQELYYKTISEESGFEIRNDRELMELLRSVCCLKAEYERVHNALEDARNTGYGIVMPTLEEMQLEEPKIVRQGGRYGVRLKASAPSIHMIMTDIETEVSPAIGGEKASEEVINFLLQGYDGDINKIWESNIFGKPLNDIAGEGLNNKIRAMPEDARNKLRSTIQRIINEGSGGLICIIL